MLFILFNLKIICYTIFYLYFIEGDFLRNSSLLNSFKNAFNGIIVPIRDERNIKIHITIMILVIIAGIVLKISIIEWIICILLFSLVISAEIINTAIENAVNYTAKNSENPIDDNAKIAKDSAAGGVLVLAIGSAIIGLVIFVPKILALI